MKACIINLQGERPNVFSALEKALKLKYSSGHDADNIIVLGYNTGTDIYRFRQQHPGKKIIVYQLEQISSPDNLWWNEKSHSPMVKARTAAVKAWLRHCDLILEYDLGNFDFLRAQGLGDKTVFCPVEFSSANVRGLKSLATNSTNLHELENNKLVQLVKISGKKNTTPEQISGKEEMEYDLLFYGAVNKKRAAFLNEAAKHFKLCVVGNIYPPETRSSIKFKVIPDKYGDDLWSYIDKSRIILNLHYYTNIQEQVRLYELLCNGKCILSQKSSWNYFGELVEEFKTTEEMINIAKLLLHNNRWKKYASVAQRFKNGEYRPYRVGAAYNSFYDLELLETSIASIRAVADYVVVIHQRHSFAGEKEKSGSDALLASLLKKGLINEIHYYEPAAFTTPQQGMLAKRNVSLELCRKNNCNYIMPLDNDECYNAAQLKREIERMYRENIHTLYSKIRAYWHDSKHYFEDSYYVPSVYRIDERRFEILTTSVLCDPVRKMKENVFRISDMPMHHLTYIKGCFEQKGVSNLRNAHYRQMYAEILNRFKAWKPGDKALVFGNNLDKGGELYAREVELVKVENRQW